MAEIQIGRYNSNTLDTPKVRDYGSVYVAVGNLLNQKYYKNREAFITNVSNPLSQIQATERGKKVLEQERSKLLAGAQEFKENGNWFAADDYIFNTVESIQNNNALKAVMADYAMEQQFNEDLKNSGWDDLNQTAIKLRSKLQSSEIQYDADTNTVTGGFNPVQIGKPFDVQKFQKDFYDILSKAKADKVSVEQLVTDPAMISKYGLDVTTGINGETIASHFIKIGSSQGGIDENMILQSAMSLLNSNPDYINYLNTIWTNRDTLNRFVKDESVAGGHLRDYSISDFNDLFKSNPSYFILEGLGIDTSIFGNPSNNGHFNVNKNLSNQAKQIIENIKSKYGFNILDLLQNKISIPQELVQTGLSNYLNNLYNIENTNVKIINGNDVDLDKTQWASNILRNKFISDNFNQLAYSAANLLAYEEFEQNMDLISNPAYEAVVKARAKSKEEEIKAIAENPPYTATLGGFIVNEDSVKENLSRANEITDQMKNLENSMRKLFTTEDLSVLGLQSGDNIKLEDFNYTTADRLIDNSELSDEHKIKLKSKLLEAQTAQRQYRVLQSKLETNELQLSKVFDIWNTYRDRIEGGIGYYRINSDKAKIILDNRLSNYEDYINYINEIIYDPNKISEITQASFVKNMTSNQRESFLRNNGYILSEEEFNEILSNAADNVSNRYRKITGNDLEFTAVRDVIANPSKFQRDHIDRSIVQWKEGRGELSVVQTPKGKGLELTGTALGKYLDFNAMPESITVGPKGTTITSRNNPTKNSHPLSGKELGLDYDIYKTTLSPIANGFASRDGYQEYVLTLYDETGAARDNMIVREPMDSRAISRQLVDNYRNIKPYIKVGGELLAESAGRIASQYSAGYIDFEPTSNGTPYVKNIAELQSAVDKLGELEYKLLIREPINGTIDGNSRTVKIGKSAQGYYILDTEGLTYNGSTHYGDFAYRNIPGSLDVIEEITPNGLRYYNTLSEALAPISEYILNQSSNVLDILDANEALRIRQIKQNSLN